MKTFNPDQRSCSIPGRRGFYLVFALLLFVATVVVSAPYSAAAAQSCRSDIPETLPVSSYAVFQRQTGGSLKDTDTGLLWAPCLLGQSWNGSLCQGTPTLYSTLKSALQAVESASVFGRNDWRLPNIKELGSIVEYRCSGPALNSQYFPLPGVGHLLSGTYDLNGSTEQFGIDLNSGATVVLPTSGPSATSFYVLPVSDDPSPPTPGGSTANTPPTISPIPDQVADPGTTIVVPISLGDAETPVADLKVGAQWYSEWGDPEPGAVVTGVGASRTLTLTPPAWGITSTSFVQVTVADQPGLTRTLSFKVTYGHAPVFDQDGPLTVVMSPNGVPRAWSAPALTATDVDSGDGLALSVVATTPTSPASGTLTFTGTGFSPLQPTAFSYVPNPGFEGVDHFTLQVTDSTGLTDTVAVQVIVLGPVGSGPSRVAAGGDQSLVIRPNGDLWHWGTYNDNNTPVAVGFPRQIAWAEEIPRPTGILENWGLVSAGTNHAVLSLGSGLLLAFGDNSVGQLGDGTTISKDSPVPVPFPNPPATWRFGLAGGNVSLGFDTAGDIYVWGYMLEQGNPVPVFTAAAPQGFSHPGGGAWLDGSVGDNHILLLDEQQMLWSMGANKSGQLGTGDFFSVPFPVPGPLAPSGQNWAQVAGGDGFSLARTDTGELWYWGGHEPPQRVATSEVWQGVWASGSKAVLIDDLGVLFTMEFSPLSLSVVDAGDGWVSAAVGSNHYLALKSNGDIYTWGDNSHWQLGTNKLGSSEALPRKIGEDFNWLPQFNLASPQAVTMDEDGKPTAWTSPSLLAQDPDLGDTLSYSIINGPATGNSASYGMPPGGVTPEVGYLPAANFNGSDSFTVQVDDGHSATDAVVIKVTVNPVSDAPTLFGPVGLSGTPTVGQTLTCNNTPWSNNSWPVTTIDYTYAFFRSPDGDPLKAVLVPGDGPTTYTLGTGDIDQQLQCCVVARSYGESLGPECSSWLTYVNGAPGLSGSPPTSINKGVTYSFTPNITPVDPEGDSLTFSLVGAPSWLWIDPATGSLDGTPTAADAGATTNNIRIEVSDGLAADHSTADNTADASLSFNLTVATTHFDSPIGGTQSLDYIGSLSIAGTPATTAGDQVAAYDPQGTLCGLTTATGDGTYGPLTVYRDDPATTGIDEGVDVGEQLTFRVWDEGGNQELYGDPSPGPVIFDPAASNPQVVAINGIPETTIAVPLAPGWNLVSFPLAVSWYWDMNPGDGQPAVAPTIELPGGTLSREVASLESLLGSIANQYEVIYGFSSQSGWTLHVPGGPSTMTHFSGGYGYWIKMKQAGNLTLSGPLLDQGAMMTLGTGWNLVGYWGADNDLTPDCFGTLNGGTDFEVLYGFEFGLGWSLYVPGPPVIDLVYALHYFRGYWVKMAAPLVLRWGAPPPP